MSEVRSVLQWRSEMALREGEREDPKLWNCGADVVNEIVVHDSTAHDGRHGD